MTRTATKTVISFPTGDADGEEMTQEEHEAYLRSLPVNKHTESQLVLLVALLRR